MLIGNLNNISIKTNTKGIYETCFPNKKSLSKFSQDTTIKPNNNKLIIYDELFMFSKNSPTVKANIINEVPINIIECISNKFDKYIGKCLKSQSKFKSTENLFKMSKMKTNKNNKNNKNKKQAKQSKKNKNKNKKKFSFFKLF